MAIPVTIVGGYLGAGKTSLINHVLTSDHGLRVAVLVNDFGAVNIDASLIADAAENTISLTNGCVCCAIQDDLGEALTAQTARASPPDHILIETSGVAEPARILTYASAWPGVRLDAIVTLVDVETICARAEDKFVGRVVRRQLAAADYLILNKLDLVPGEAARDVSEWLRGQAPAARQLEAQHGRVEAALLFGRVDAGARASSVQPDWGTPAHVRFHSAAFDVARPVDLETLVASLRTLPDSIHRLKGYVTDAKCGQRKLLQRVGSRHTIADAPRREMQKGQDRLVVIGTDASELCSVSAAIVRSCR